MSDNQIDLYEQFIRLEWLIRRYQLQNHRAFGPMSDPHRGQGRVLALLKLKPEISQKELSSILDIRPQSLGELLSKLERSGYITRTPSEADRRVMDICLTDEGREAAQNEEQPDSDNLFGCLNQEEQATLGDYLSRVIIELQKQFGDDESDVRGRSPHGSPFGDGRFDPHHHIFAGWPDFRGGGFAGPQSKENKTEKSDKD